MVSKHTRSPSPTEAERMIADELVEPESMAGVHGHDDVSATEGERMVADGLVEPGVAHKHPDEGSETEGERIIADGLAKP